MKNMTYEMFCAYVQEKLQHYYGQETNVKLQCVQKVNGVLLHGITVLRANRNITPTLYLENFYEEYQNGTGMQEIIRKFIKEYEHVCVQEDVDISFFEIYEKVKPHLGFKLINYEMNWQLLQDVPHKKIWDLAVVCYCNVADERIGKGTILIRSDHLQMWNADPDILIRDAIHNMQRIVPAELINMNDLLKELYDDPADILGGELPMYVLTNKRRIYGAASLLYEEQLARIAEIIQDDFYMLPSSIHEIIILPKKYGTDEKHLSQMVDQINQEQLDREEILSNHAYLYSRHTKDIALLPLVPYKKNTGKNHY